MLSSGFANTPASRAIVVGLVITSFLASLTDSKVYAWIEVSPHFWQYGQFWRLLTWQLCYTNSTEVLFAAMAFYHLRIIERLWGTRKFASFLAQTFLYTTFIPPLLLALVIRPLSFNRINYLPAGPTPLLFALLVQYYAAIPYTYKYRISSSSTNADSAAADSAILLTSKATSYLLPLQLALAQLPGSLLAALVGWVIGWAYRRELLPGAARWRLPVSVVGGIERKQRYETLRRRMEGEAGRATGVEGNTEGNERGNETRRRGVVGGLIDQLRGGAL